MGLEDVVGLVTNDRRTKDKIINLLTVLGKRRLTFQQLLIETGYSERYLRFLITKLRLIRLMMGENLGGEYTYYLSYEGFSTYLKTKYSDAIYNLVKRH